MVIVRSSVRVHLLNLQDGSAHYEPPSNIIAWTVPQRRAPIASGGLAVTRSRAMICTFHVLASYESVWTVLVWDLKTRELVRTTWSRGSIPLTSSQVFSLSTMEWSELIDPGVLFLDEFRIMVSISEDDVEDPAPKLAVFDTLVPQDNSNNLLRFNFPSQHQDASVLVHVDPDRHLGARTGDVPFITDPTQSILVIQLSIPGRRSVLLVVRIQGLIERVCSTRTHQDVPWEEWGRGAVILETPFPSFDLLLRLHVRGTRLMTLETSSRNGQGDNICFRAFDFSWRGSGTLPLLDEGCGVGKRALFEGGREFVFGGSDYIHNMRDMKSLYDGRFVHVSHLFPENFVLDRRLENQMVGAGSEALHIWELS